MGLSMYERQVLAAIEHELRREDPRFAAQLDLLAPADVVPPQRRLPVLKRRTGLLGLLVALVAVAMSAVVAAMLTPPGCASCAAQDLRRPAVSCPEPSSEYPAKCGGRPVPDHVEKR